MDLRRLALRIKLNKIGGSIVQHVALMINHLRVHGIKAKMVQGYALAEKSGCWHVWAVEGDNVYDLASYMFPDIQVELALEFPEGYERDESKDEQGKYILDENQRLFDLYTRDEKAFWKEAPPKVRNFSVV